ncbi:outer membrane beta-barrel protein [Cytophagaceae bacterium YF14B1]|uniref:Outer membrane beta-barrel protein n=1 Tax=Xanthocytophaga flava TaxID=3048013 RepID=A0AAE3R0H4_9BACT|nr:outer membrane beta-barrel protein [Xanthocytophaga flavus]MDJ1486069.1 outer membrane beta-barrel protein [Xanthocytophaga flavus]
MKNLFYFTFCTFITSILSFNTIFAQTQKGRFMAGPSIGKFSFGKSYSDIAFDIKAGYFIVDNLAIGITPSYSYSWATDNVRFKEKINVLGIGPFVRYYFGEGKLKPLLNASFLYHSRKANVTYSPIMTPDGPIEGYAYEFKGGYKLLQAGGGIAYFLSNTISLEGIVNYGRYIDYNENTDVKAGEVSIGLGVQIFIGQ